MAESSFNSSLNTSLVANLEEELKCGICLEIFNTPVVLPCGHNFCKECIWGIIDNGSSFAYISIGQPHAFNCPVCQATISLRKYSFDELPVNRVLENIIELYRNNAPVDIFDDVWNCDIPAVISDCDIHKLPLDRYCDSCSESVCQTCEQEMHRPRHKVKSVKLVANDYQSAIADTLTEMKKSCVPLADRVQLLEDMLSGIETNQERIDKELEHQVNLMMSALRSQHEELQRTLHNDMDNIKGPIIEDLRHCKSIRTNVQELMGKLSQIRKTKDVNLRIKLMKDTRSQLEQTLFTQLAWYCQDSITPEVTMPTWNLVTTPVTEAIGGLCWQRTGDTNIGGISVKLLTETRSSQTSPTQEAVATGNQSQADRPANDSNSDTVSETNVSIREGSPSRSTVIVNIEHSPQGDMEQSPVRSRASSRSPQRSYDEPDGGMPLRTRDIDHLTVPTQTRDGTQISRNSSRDRVDESQNGSQHTDGVEHLSVESQQSHLLDKKAVVSVETNGEHLVAMATSTLNGMPDRRSRVRRSFPLDMSEHSDLRPSTADAPATRVKHEGTDSERPLNADSKPTETHHRTNSKNEALAEFIARRKTISPAKVSPDRKHTDNTGPQSRNGLVASRSSPALKNREIIHTQTESSGGIVGIDSPQVVKQNERETKARKDHHGDSKSLYLSSQHADDTDSGPASLHSDTSPKPFLKQPLGVDLDFDLLPSPADRHRRENRSPRH